MTSRKRWWLFVTRARARPIFSSPRAALRSANTISFTRPLPPRGMDLSFWKVAMRPGRPLMHGLLGGMHVLGLPGNPVSSYVGAFLFLAPLIRRMTGRDDLSLVTESAVLGCDLPANDERADYLRATLANALPPVATP